jgi:hypothetical protein
VGFTALSREERVSLLSKNAGLEKDTCTPKERRTSDTLINVGILLLMLLTFLAYMVTLAIQGFVRMDGRLVPCSTKYELRSGRTINPFWLPILCKACTSGFVYFVGDVLPQHSEGTLIEDMDRMRAVRSLTAGFVGHETLQNFLAPLEPELL